MEEQRIKIAHVLAEIDNPERNGQLHTFAIRYVKTDGKPGFKPVCRKSGSQVTTRAASGNTKFKYNVKKSGTILLVDHTNDRPFALKISLLTHYNGIRIQH